VTTIVLVALLSVTPTEIFRDYKASIKKADAKYKDKQVEVRGVLQSVGASYSALYLKADGLKDGLTAAFLSSEIIKASKLQVGQDVVLSCTGGGWVLGEPLLYRCTIK
jgi:hypothetical protein